jgi:hypothetical protein
MTVRVPSLSWQTPIVFTIPETFLSPVSKFNALNVLVSPQSRLAARYGRDPSINFMQKQLYAFYEPVPGCGDYINRIFCAASHLSENGQKTVACQLLRQAQNKEKESN